jgi:D-proline reductase (dithiol) PrdB
VSLVARHLEAHGLPTVIVGSARDIVEHCGVPRFLFNDFPLGNPCGHPDRPDMQRAIVKSALGLLESASGPRTTLVSPYAWKDDPHWRARYGRVDPAERDRLIAVGEARRQRQGEAARLRRG